MGNPASGYDLSAQLSNTITSTEKAVTASLSSLSKSTKVQAAVSKGVASIAKNAADELKNKLGSKISSVNNIANSISSLKALATKSSTSFGGMAGQLQDQAASSTAGLSSLLGASDASDEEMSAAATSSMSLINAKLADSMFTALPTEKVLAVDAYGVTDNTTLNSVVGKLTGFAKDLASSAGGMSSIGKDLLSTVLKSKSLDINVDALKDRVISSLGGKSGIVSSLSKSLQKSLERTGLPSNVYNSITTTIGDVTSTISTGNVKDASSLFNLIGRVTGNSALAQYLDVGAEATVLSTIVRESISLGVPNAINVLLENSKSSEASYYALQSNLIVAANGAELDVLTQMIDTLGTSRVLADCPDTIQRVLRNYAFPSGTTASDYPARFTELNNVLSAIDPTWGWYNRDGVLVKDLSFFSGISEDAKTLLTYQGSFSDIMYLVDTYSTQDLVTLTKQNYPNIVI